VANELTPLDYAERWLRDGLHACGRAGAIEAIDADATTGAAILQRFGAEGAPITWTHVFVRATAMVLAAKPHLHKPVAGNSRLTPSTVDICLSLSGDYCVTPVLIIKDAANKDIREIAAEVKRGAPLAMEENRKVMAKLRRFGWLVPFSGLRRALLGFLFRRSGYRRRISGTFHVTCLPQVDFFAPLLFNSAAALGVGRVRDRVVAVDGRAVVRPTVTLCCCLDHGQWNGMAAARFLTALRDIVESGEFAEEMQLLPAAAVETVRIPREPCGQPVHESVTQVSL
jgi:pyruvate/2-oxoglutarate dehydrogenase complex dihydrolipoamide acyltransferase (E2) component